MKEIALDNDELEELETKERERAQRSKRPEKKSGRSVFRLKKIIEEKEEERVRGEG